MNKLDQINELLKKLSLQNAQIHYSYNKENKFFVKTEKIFTDEEKLPSYINKLSLSSGKIDKKSYKNFINSCEEHRKMVLSNIENIKIELPDRQNKNYSCINSVGLVACKDLPDYMSLTTSQQNLTYNFVVGTYIQGFEHYKEHLKTKRVYFKLIKETLQDFLLLIRDYKKVKNFLSSNLPIMETIENDLVDLLDDFQDFEKTTKIIISSYDKKVHELLLTSTGSIKKVAD